MKYRTILFGYSWIGLLNICLLQWLFIRLGANVDYEKNITSFKLLYFIVPLTGWWSGYIYLNVEKAKR